MFRIVISFPEGVSFYFDPSNPTGLVERTNLAKLFETRDQADTHVRALQGAFGNGTARVEAAPDPVPAGFTPVSKETFFRLLAADKYDIMPRADHPTHSTWRRSAASDVWGWTAPGWRNPDEHEAVYAIRSTDYYEASLREHLAQEEKPGYYRAKND